jgi:HD-like signal output (HDOD) protein
LSLLKSREHLQLLLDRAQIQSLGWRHKLAQADEHHWLVYVLSGEIQLKTSDGGEERVSAGSLRASAPLFLESGATGVARSGTQILRVDRKLADMLLNEEKRRATEVNETELSAHEAEIIATIYAAFAQGELRVPSLPDVALAVRDAVNLRDAGVAEVARTVQSDPALSGRIVQASNSAAYGGLQNVTTLIDAINRLGLKATRNLATALAVRDLFKTRSANVRKIARHVYRHSAQVAAMCSVLAREHTDIPPEQALLAGLTHDIGAIPVLNYVDDKPEIADDIRAVLSAIEKLRAPAGVLVLSNWAFEQTLIDAAEQADDWQRDSGPQIDMGDLVVAAQLHLAAQAGAADSFPPLVQTPAGRKLGADEEGLPAALVKRAAEEIAATRDLLLG